MRSLIVLLSALFGVVLVVALLSFLVVAVLTYLWNVVIPFFGGPSITYWVCYAGYWLLAIISLVARGGVSYSKE
jgi:hypothetical protein